MEGSEKRDDMGMLLEEVNQFSCSILNELGGI
uniref:Uncharacterized protein n=1 Tax=Anguilla anguilla TaxID=7936 RepID=A0A0E9U3R1_ANGAN